MGTQFTPALRKKIEEKIDRFLRTIEPSGRNAEKYRKRFSGMDDKQFLAFFKKMAQDPNNNFYVEIDLFDKKGVTMKSIKQAATQIGVPLEEYVTVYHTAPSGEANVIGVRSAYKVPVFHVHLKRMQQLLSKKARMNTDIMKAGARSKLTGSLGNADRTGRLTDSDTLALLSATANTRDDYNDVNDAINQITGGDPDNYILREILGARADNLHEKYQMNAEISAFGTSSISKMDRKQIHGGQALNTLDVFLIGAGLKSDLITGGLTTKQALRDNSKTN
jgi:hypothetical protein